ncbi:hypothetical protein, partial [Escherichia coli]|uniref:hypothetical protein n=1 Tax=Escherichia coli TaxID=562 RepID=UPI0013B42EFC
SGMYKKTAKAQHRKLLKKERYAPSFNGTALNVNNGSSFEENKKRKEEKRIRKEQTTKQQIMKNNKNVPSLKQLDQAAKDRFQRQLERYLKQQEDRGS